MTYKTPVILATAIVTISGLLRLDNPLQEKALPIPTLTPTTIITPTALPTPTATPKPKPTKVPTPTIKPQPKFTSQQIYEMIDKYSQEAGVDPNLIRHMAICESGFKPSAKNYIYAGLFQYDAATWKSFRKVLGASTDPDLRYNAEEAIKTTVYLIKQNKAYLWPNCIPK